MTKDQKSQFETAFGLHQNRIYTIKLKVNAVSKGTGIKVGDEITKGDKVVAYLTLKVGKKIFEPLLPNGFEILPAEKKPE